MSENRFNTVAIIDAIPGGEWNTARRLREDIMDTSMSLDAGSMIRYYRTESLNDLAASIVALVTEYKKGEMVPAIHVEGHGLVGERGFALPNGDQCRWEVFRDYITPLNVAMQLNLMVVLATCFGGSFVRAIRTTDPAPVWGLIGPTREITAGQVHGDFGAFYRTLFKTGSGGQAIQVLNERAIKGLYMRTTAEGFFLEVWKGYKRDYCSKDTMKTRVRRIYRQGKELKNGHHVSIGQLKRRLKKDESAHFSQYRDRYFMFDLYPSNRARFPITYKAAEEYASR